MCGVLRERQGRMCQRKGKWQELSWRGTGSRRLTTPRGQKVTTGFRGASGLTSVTALKERLAPAQGEPGDRESTQNERCQATLRGTQPGGKGTRGGLRVWGAEGRIQGLLSFWLEMLPGLDVNSRLHFHKYSSVLFSPTWNFNPHLLTTENTAPSLKLKGRLRNTSNHGSE